jgi:hypothetical protein
MLVIVMWLIEPDAAFNSLHLFSACLFLVLQ